MQQLLQGVARHILLLAMVVQTREVRLIRCLGIALRRVCCDTSLEIKAHTVTGRRRCRDGPCERRRHGVEQRVDLGHAVGHLQRAATAPEARDGEQTVEGRLVETCGVDLPGGRDEVGLVPGGDLGQGVVDECLVGEDRSAAATAAAVEQGVWLRPFGRLIYIMPPFISTEDEVAQICRGVRAAVGGGKR